jgi:PAS domain S-box-containing protein
MEVYLPQKGIWAADSVDPVLDEQGRLTGVVHIIRDITDRKQAEESLRESEEKYRALVENSPNLVAIYQEGSLKYVNKAMCEKLGWTFEEMTSPSFNPVEKIIPQRLQSQIRENIAKRLRGESISPYEISIKTRDGSEIPVIVKAQAILYCGKLADEVIHIDITERKLAEEALRESEERFRRLYEQAPLGYQSLDAEACFIDVNQAWLDLLGYSRDQVIGHWFGDFLAPQEVDAFKQRFSRFKAAGEVHVDLEMVQLAGFTIIVHIDGRIAHDEHGQFKQTHCILHDITERKKAEERVKAERQRLYDVLETLPVMVCLLTPDYHVTFANRVFRQKFGEDNGRFCYDYIFGRKGPCEFCEAHNVLKTGKPHHWECTGPDGYSIIDVYDFPFTDTNGSPLILEMDIDITERKQAEQKLLEDRAQLKSLASQLTLAEERERHRLATELHDRISQSLVVSKIKLDALRKSGRSRKLDKALEDVCNSIGQTIQDTRTLTFDLGSPVLHELGFETAVSEWLTDRIQKKHGITVEFEDDGEPKPLDDDVRILLFRDVRELLINVVKHAGAHKVKVSIRKLDNHICVTVEDNGVGFDPAEVVSMAAKRGEFGLFSIRERLEDLGGHLQIDSAPGRGCKVTMTAPLKRKEITDGRNKTTRQGKRN